MRGHRGPRLEYDRREAALEEMGGRGEADGTGTDDGDRERGQVGIHEALLDFFAVVSHDAPQAATACPIRATFFAGIPWQQFSVMKATSSDIAAYSAA